MRVLRSLLGWWISLSVLPLCSDSWWLLIRPTRALPSVCHKIEEGSLSKNLMIVLGIHTPRPFGHTSQNCKASSKSRFQKNYCINFLPSHCNRAFLSQRGSYLVIKFDGTRAFLIYFPAISYREGCSHHRSPSGRMFSAQFAHTVILAHLTVRCERCFTNSDCSFSRGNSFFHPRVIWSLTYSKSNAQWFQFQSTQSCFSQFQGIDRKSKNL